MPDGKTDGSSEGPAGIPIGRGLVIPPGVIHDDLREAVRIVSRIHGDGGLPPVPMRVARLATSRHGNRVRRGRFVLNEDTGQPTSIVIEAGESHRVFAALHEIGRPHVRIHDSVPDHDGHPTARYTCAVELREGTAGIAIGRGRTLTAAALRCLKDAEHELSEVDQRGLTAFVDLLDAA